MHTGVDWELASRLPGGPDAAETVRELAYRSEREMAALSQLVGEYAAEQAQRKT